MEDWSSLREAYISSEESISALAEKYGLSPRGAYRRCGAEGWVKLRQARRQGNKDPLQAAADALLSRVRQVLESSEEMDVKSMRDLAAVLKEIRGMQEGQQEDGVSVSLGQEVMDYSG